MDIRLIGDTRCTCRHDDSGRLTTVDGNTAKYMYNALGQRVEKTVNGMTTVFIYDESGHLLGEYTPSGTVIEETTWLNDRPIGIITPTGLHYVQTDQLDTPRYITNASKQLMWEWLSDPFGEGAPNENPSGLGTFTYNLRFPGQYYDAETGHNYNYFRDYDPSIGRYIESDPIGLVGGVNTYAYVEDNPITNIDLLGLCGENNKQHCEELLPIDTDTCNAITRRRGAQAGATCHASAAERYAACLRGRPVPPLNTWNNRQSLSPLDWKFWEQVTGLSGGALVAYLIISEGSRIFPPRDLVPVP